MKKTLSNQEYCDLQSALTIAIKHAPKNNPEFKEALEKLSKKLWKTAVKVHMTTTLADRVLISLRSEQAARGVKKK